MLVLAGVIMLLILSHKYKVQRQKIELADQSFAPDAEESKNIKGFAFVWITDGLGWKSAKNNLEETFDSMENIYNLNELSQGKLKELLK